LHGEVVKFHQNQLKSETISSKHLRFVLVDDADVKIIESRKQKTDPDINLFINRTVAVNMKQFRCTIRHAAMLRGKVLPTITHSTLYTDTQTDSSSAMCASQ